MTMAAAQKNIKNDNGRSSEVGSCREDPALLRDVFNGSDANVGRSMDGNDNPECI